MITYVYLCNGNNNNNVTKIRDFFQTMQIRYIPKSNKHGRNDDDKK